MIIIGVDEVGRGCWAGPLVAGAVAFDMSGPVTEGLNDSKKLSKMARERLNPLIQKEALTTGLGWIEPGAIDISGITEAVKGAMYAAVQAVLAQLGEQSGEVEIIVDGSYDFLKDYQGLPPVRTMVGADGLVPAVSAASILAKVARDDYMATTAHAAFPAYGFDKHVGYGTAAHIAALNAHGVTDLHRKSYKPIQKFLQSI